MEAHEVEKILVDSVFEGVESGECWKRVVDAAGSRIAVPVTRSKIDREFEELEKQWKAVQEAGPLFVAQFKWSQKNALLAAEISAALAKVTPDTPEEMFEVLDILRDMNEPQLNRDYRQRGDRFESLLAAVDKYLDADVAQAYHVRAAELFPENTLLDGNE